jgi:hypothetical protein
LQGPSDIKNKKLVGKMLHRPQIEKILAFQQELPKATKVTIFEIIFSIFLYFKS